MDTDTDIKGVGKSSHLFSFLGFFKAIYPYYQNDRTLLYLLLFLSVIEAVSSLLFSYAPKPIMDAISKDESIYYLLGIIGFYMCLFFICIGVVIGISYLSSRLGIAAINRLRVVLFHGFLSLPFVKSHSMKTGDLISQFTDNLSMLENVFVRIIPSAFSMFFCLILSVILLFYLKWFLSLLMLVLLSLSFLLSSPLKRKADAVNVERMAGVKSLTNLFSDSILLLLPIKVFFMAKRQERQLDTVISEYSDVFQRSYFFSELSMASITLCFQFSLLCVLSVGAILVFNKMLMLSTLVAFLTMLFLLSGLIAGVVGLLPMLIQAGAIMSDIKRFLSDDHEIVSNADTVDLPAYKKQLSVRKLNFSYSEGDVSDDVNGLGLTDIDLSVRPGEFIALVGGSGSGKSTLLNLILGLYAPQSGEIKVDGYHLNQLNSRSRLKLMSIVLQDTLLFNMSIYKNISIVKPEATRQEVINVAKAADLHDMVMGFPQAYDTIVGNFGTDLSGGTRQRVAIARALLLDSPILLLDEATSALDPITEAEVIKTLNRLQDKTIILVTHRLNTVIGVDKIYVMDHGKIVASGSHNVLLKQPGLYKKLWEKQHGIILNSDQTLSITLEHLRRVDIFKDFKDEELKEMHDYFEIYHGHAGERLVKQGEMGNEFYFIVRGAVDVMFAKDGKEVKLARLIDGDYFGEISLLTHIPRQASVVVTEPSIFVTLHGDHFLKILSHHPHLKALFQEIAASRLEELKRF